MLKRKLIKARKSGTYSRLLKKYRKKWYLAKHIHSSDENDHITRHSEEFQPESQRVVTPINEVEEPSNIVNEEHDQAENSKHTFIFKVLIYLFINNIFSTEKGSGYRDPELVHRISYQSGSAEITCRDFKL